MNKTAVLAVRFLRASEIQSDRNRQTHAIPGVPGVLSEFMDADDDRRSSVADAMDHMFESSRSYFEQEIGELIGGIPPELVRQQLDERPIRRRMFVNRIDRGVPRLELRLMQRSIEMDWISFDELEAAVNRSELDLLYFCSEQGHYRQVGQSVKLYTYLKARFFRLPFGPEWDGRSDSQLFISLLMELERALSVTLAPITSLRQGPQIRAFLGLVDELLSREDGGLRDNGIDRVLEAAGLDWKRWQRAGRGILSRLGLRRIWF